MSKSLFSKLRSLPMLPTLIVAAGIVAGVVVRFVHLTQPSGKIFDEVYFPVFAQNYINHTYFFDVHPPLGKLFIALGLLIFGNNPLGWRAMPLLAGLAMIGLAAFLGQRALKSRHAAVVLAFFIAVDGIFIVYSRTGLMDIILTFTIFLCLALAYNMRTWRQALATASVLGLAISIKWPAIGVLVPVMWLAWRQGSLKKLLWLLPWSLAIYIGVFMFGQYLVGKPLTMFAFLDWNIQAFQYHENLKDTHPWGSMWWSWPLLRRPVLFWYEAPIVGKVQAIWAMGNPFLWWGSTLAVIGSFLHVIWKAAKRQLRPDHPLIVPLLGYCALYLPWAAIKRVVFLYHYVPAYVFALMMLAYWLGVARQKYEAYVNFILFLILITSVLYFPVFCGWIVPQGWVKSIMILKTWW